MSEIVEKFKRFCEELGGEFEQGEFRHRCTFKERKRTAIYLDRLKHTGIEILGVRGDGEDKRDSWLLIKDYEIVEITGHNAEVSSAKLRHNIYDAAYVIKNTDQIEIYVNDKHIDITLL